MQAIQVRRNGNTNIIRWTYQGIRYSLTWGKWNDPLDKARLNICAQIIYQDCLAGLLDESLNKYRLWLSGVVTSGNGNGHSTPKKLPPITKLLQDRIQENYNDADAALLNLINQYPKRINTPSDAREFIKWLGNRGIKDTSKKRYLAILQVIRRDLFGDIEVKIAEKPRPKPFTRNEVDRILHSFKHDEYYSHYYSFILFLFNSGIRTSEAIGLLWRDVDIPNKQIHIYESLVRGKGNSSKRIRKSTKTRRYRIIPMNNKLYELFTEMRLGDPGKLVFTSPKGKPIDDHNLSQRAWRKTLEKLRIPHRPLYNTRSTFVSHCIQSGMSVTEVAAITGHSIQVLYDHYLGPIRAPNLPEL